MFRHTRADYKLYDTVLYSREILVDGARIPIVKSGVIKKVIEELSRGESDYTYEVQYMDYQADTIKQSEILNVVKG